METPKSGTGMFVVLLGVTGTVIMKVKKPMRL